MAFGQPERDANKQSWMLLFAGKPHEPEIPHCKLQGLIAKSNISDIDPVLERKRVDAKISVPWSQRTLC
jgi:hypothetical protein